VDTAGIAALGVTIGIAIVIVCAAAVCLIRRQDREDLRQALARETDRIERKLGEANMEAGVLVARASLCADRAAASAERAATARDDVGEASALVGMALTSVMRAARAADRAELARDRSVLASEAAAQHAQQAGDRAQDASLWARVAGAAHARPIELRRSDAGEAEPTPPVTGERLRRG
jgi:hypothetical protein